MEESGRAALAVVGTGRGRRAMWYTEGSSRRWATAMETWSGTSAGGMRGGSEAKENGWTLPRWPSLSTTAHQGYLVCSS